jgi:hypothetical protein
MCDTKSCSDGISMVIATTLLCTNWITINCNCPTQVQVIIYYLNFVIICGLGFMCLYSYYSGTFHIFHSVFFDISF